RLVITNSSHLSFFSIFSQAKTTLFPYTTLFRSYPVHRRRCVRRAGQDHRQAQHRGGRHRVWREGQELRAQGRGGQGPGPGRAGGDRKSTRLNSSHVKNSYAVICLKREILKNNNT